MPYTLTTEPTFLRVVLHGVITHQELQALAHDLAVIEASREITPDRLTDLGAVTAPHPTFPDVQALARRRKIQPLSNAVKSAIVAPRPIHLGFARMYQNLNQHPQITIEIFTTMEAAEAWLRAQ
jgi:hypothetical protein